MMAQATSPMPGATPQASTWFEFSKRYHPCRAAAGARSVRRGAQPMRLGMTLPGPTNSLFRRTSSLFGQRNSLFSEEQGIGCELLNPLDDQLPKPRKEARIV